MNTKQEIGRRIKWARTRLNLTLRQVCEQVPGLSEPRLGNYEAGIRTPDVDMIKVLAKALRVKPGYLLTFDDEPGDERESVILKSFRHTDERGKEAIAHIAESQQRYGGQDDDRR